MNWFKNYYNKKYSNDFIDYEEYFNSNIDTPKDTTILMEEEYFEKLNKINLLINKNNLTEYSKKNSLQILEESNDIIKLLSKYTLQNNYIDYKFFINTLNILYELSEILRIRLNQEKYNKLKASGNNYLSRCSYKFCNFKEECYYNYNKKIPSVCYQDHYVHNMVSLDIKTLKEYINNNKTNDSIIIPNKEILRSINTLCFVINHMYMELKTKCLYLTEEEYEKMHFIKIKV